MAVYLEALENLSVNELEIGCAEVIKTALTFPKPAEIISASHAHAKDESFLGPPMIEYPEVEICSVCHDTGWKVIPRRDGAGSMAIACECRKRKSA